MGQQLGGKLHLMERILDILKHFPKNLTTVFESPYIAKSENYFTTLIAFVKAYIFSILRTGFFDG